MALTEQMQGQGTWLFKHRGVLPLIHICDWSGSVFKERIKSGELDP
jgi:hypothetical protein